MLKSATHLALTGMLFLGSASVVLAQAAAPAAPDAPPPPPGMHGHHMMAQNPDKQLAHMTAKLNLTADQQAQIKPILQDEQQQMQTLHSDTSMSRDDKRAKAMSMHQDSTQKIEAVLNDQQKQKFEADQQKMQERHSQMQGGAGEAPPPPPPQ